MFGAELAREARPPFAHLKVTVAPSLVVPSLAAPSLFGGDAGIIFYSRVPSGAGRKIMYVRPVGSHRF